MKGKEETDCKMSFYCRMFCLQTHTHPELNAAYQSVFFVATQV